jgi:hypothetical protein
VADADPETKAAHFEAKINAVADQAFQMVSSFADADEVTQQATITSVLVTYDTLANDTGNSAALSAFLNSKTGRVSSAGQRRRRRLQDEAQSDVDAGACVGGAPSLDDLRWSFNGATFFMLTTMTTIGYGMYACMGARHVHEIPSSCSRPRMSHHPKSARANSRVP